ncbi:fimbrial protein [Cupriavidus basilensis]|uniref:Fimbrial protein n=1 Tax=Cupriavidus basilensis TaxID=68895 RepID=A0ABT6B3G1_9BURK|nr:fimbrial protein [Cupriavidus basilensis]MDF3839158.1 fimbrial protein [Cupriavidus basilensis]
MSRILALLFILAGALLPVCARASCIYVTSDSQVGYFNFDPGPNFTVNPNLPVGSVLLSWSGTQAAAVNTTSMMPVFRSGLMSVGWKCTTNPNPYTFRGTTGAPNGNVYPTSIPGIGVRITLGSYVFPSTYWSQNDVMLDGGTYYGNYLTPSYPLLVELIKTGPVTSGGTLTGEFAGWFTPDNTQVVSYRLRPGGIVIKPTYPTCAPTVPNQGVPLGTVAAGTLDANTYSNQVNFNVNLMCSGGNPTTTSSNVYVTFTDANNPTNTTDMLSLAPGSQARGVAVQILWKGNPIKYGPDSSAAGNTNQFLVLPSQLNGNASIPLTARFAKTGPVTAGAATAVSTFTFSYQ